MLRTMLSLFWLCVGLVAQPDLSKISRAIVKQPDYVGEPRYALFAFGDKAQTRLWAVLDKSQKDLAYQDVLYFDLDGDGDLTDDNERFSAKYNPKGEPAGTAMRIVVPEFTVPGSDVVHRDFRVHTVPKKGRTGCYWTLLWRGKVKLSGGYGPVGTNTTVWGKSPGSAPVFRPTADGPYGFGLYAWGSEEWKLQIGGADKVFVMIGPKGLGDGTLAVFDETHIDLEKNELVATLVAKTTDGQDLTVPVRIRNHC